MNLSDIKTLYQYNAWAQDRVMEVLASVHADVYAKEGQSSHGGIHGTLVHILAAMDIWLARWRGEPSPKMVRTADIPDFAAAENFWRELKKRLASFIDNLRDEDLQSTVRSTTSTGEVFEDTLWKTMQHLVNHSTYHRGQIITMLRQSAVKPAGTDLIAFYRTQQGT